MNEALSLLKNLWPLLLFASIFLLLLLNKRTRKPAPIIAAILCASVLFLVLWPDYHFRKGMEKKAKEVGEPKRNLGSIFISQVTYYGEEDIYASSIENLGWAPEGKTYYSYSITEADSAHFVARAEANIDDDSALNVWEIDEKRKLRWVVNDLHE